jgi:opacity protein-like surface antigen
MPDQVRHDEIITTEPEPARKHFSISAYGHGGQASSEQLKGYGMNQTGAYLGTRAIGGNSKGDVGGMMRTLASNKASTFEAHHAGPVRMGVTAAWELAPHLSLVSGLNWTTLHSEFDESVEPFHTVTSQDLGFLGVPLRLGTDWNVWKGLYLHASAGGMVEKGLLSSSWTNSWVEGQEAESVKNPKPDTGGLFWSVGASAGAEYRFNDFIGVYLTPGIEYHFNNGSTLRCAYTEKPLHWNAELGVRFHFGGE